MCNLCNTAKPQYQSKFKILILVLLRSCTRISFDMLAEHYFLNPPMSSATLRRTATRSTCVANLCLSILAAAALHGEEPGEAEDEDDKRTDRHDCSSVQIGTGALILKYSGIENIL